MNYLAHLHLGGQRPEELLGSLYGDFVKGPLAGRWPTEIEAAIRLHRRIDAFTDSHPLQARARARFPAARRRTAGMLLDLFFDHCLARDWVEYAAQPLDHFTREVYRVLAAEPELPGRLALMAPRMAAQDWLGSYRDVAAVGRVIERMAVHRMRRANPLPGGIDEFLADPAGFAADFAEFLPDARAFAAAWRAQRR